MFHTLRASSGGSLMRSHSPQTHVETLSPVGVHHAQSRQHSFADTPDNLSVSDGCDVFLLEYNISYLLVSFGVFCLFLVVIYDHQNHKIYFSTSSHAGPVQPLGDLGGYLG
ncbi:hypothetical protein FKM82_007219 [Ascaphus truei]